MAARVLRMHRLVYWCAGGLVVANSLPHLFPAYSRASCEMPDIPAPDELVSHVRKIADAMGLANSQRIEVFISGGYSSVSAGSARFPMGAVVGLPRAVLFRGTEDVIRSNPTLRGVAVPWDSHEGRSLIKLLPPSTNTINFRIAHELAHLQKHDWLWGVVLSPLMLVSGYHLSVFLCKSVFATNIQLAFPLLFSLTIFAYAEIKTLINHWQEYRADRRAAMCSHKYAQGGIELMRNTMQLEALFGAKASSSVSFTSGLNQVMNELLFSSHPPLDKRLQKLECVLALHFSNDIH